MKKTTIALIAASLLPLAAFAQNLAPSVPPVPPVAPVPPVPAVPPVPPVPPFPGDGRDGRDRAPKVPVTYLGVETSELPGVVADQLGMPKGFGLVVDYVVPDGPAAAAGVQQNDIIKMFNDQILMEPDQLSKLIRSYPEGTTVTLTVLRKGAETKLPAKLGKREVTQRRGHDRGWRGPNMGQLGPDLEKLTEELGQMQFGKVDGDHIRSEVERAQRDAQRAQRDAIRVARDDARRVEREAREASREARQAAREAAREARRATQGFRFSYGDDGALKTTHIDMGKAQIVYHDDKGELKIDNVAGKRVLTAKDPQGRTVFSGPVETKEELDKLPADVRQRFDKLEQKDLPAIAPTVTGQDNDGDDDDNDGDEVSAEEVVNICGKPAPKSPFRKVMLNTVLI
jgi:hypothetical protein